MLFRSLSCVFCASSRLNLEALYALSVGARVTCWRCVGPRVELGHDLLPAHLGGDFSRITRSPQRPCLTLGALVWPLFKCQRVFPRSPSCHMFERVDRKSVM